MKKPLLTIIACVAFSVAGFAQGQVNFNNRVADPANPGSFLVDAPIFDVGGATLADGPGFMAQLYAGPSAAELAPIGDALPLRAGAGAGYINITGADPVRIIPTVGIEAAATIQIRAWDVASGATWETAVLRGESNIFTVTTGGGTLLPANLIGLSSFEIVPEPSTVALGILGFAALLFRFRRK